MDDKLVGSMGSPVPIDADPSILGNLNTILVAERKHWIQSFNDSIKECITVSYVDRNFGDAHSVEDNTLPLV